MEFLQTGAGYLNHQPYLLHHEVGRFWVVVHPLLRDSAVWSVVLESGKISFVNHQIVAGLAMFVSRGKVAIFEKKNGTSVLKCFIVLDKNS